MEQELKQRAVEVLDSIIQATQNASAFAVEQMPDVAQQYVLYGRVYLTALFVFFIVLAVVATYTAYKIETHPKVKAGGAGGIATFAAMVVNVVAFCVVAINLSDLVKVWAAPKVWLLTELAKLIK